MSYIARIEPKVDAFFPRRPKAPYGVKRLEAEREPGMTFGTYEPPSPTEPRGLYRFNGSKLEERSLLTAGPLIYHELVPGHHFQIALQSENEAIPPFRRELWDTAYVEGWGEYASALAEEMGMYSDPYDLYGRLSMDMFLAVRLVVDTGMNAMGWPRAKAVAVHARPPHGERHPDRDASRSATRWTSRGRPSPTRWAAAACASCAAGPRRPSARGSTCGDSTTASSEAAPCP